MDWTADLDHFENDGNPWQHEGTNIALDFPGDPVRADKTSAVYEKHGLVPIRALA